MRWSSVVAPIAVPINITLRVAMVAAVVSQPLVAGAQALDAQNFRPATAGSGLLVTSLAAGLEPAQASVAWSSTYAHELLLTDPPEGGAARRVLGPRVDGALSAALGLGSGWLGPLKSMVASVDVGLTLPVVLWQHQDVQLQGQHLLEQSANSAGLGDLATWGRVGTSAAGVNVALLATLSFPTAVGGPYLGNESLVFTPEAAVSKAFGPWLLVVNLGWSARQNKRVHGLNVSDQLTWRAGGSFTATLAQRPVTVMLEGFGMTRGTRPFRATRQSPVEALMAVRAPVAGWSVHVGGGAGLNGGYATPSWRGIVGVSRLFDGAAAQAADEITL